MRIRQAPVVGRLLVAGVLAAPVLVVGTADAAGISPTPSATVGAPAAAGAVSEWPVAGQNIRNTRFAAAESKVGPGNVSQLAARWTLSTGGDVAATPTMADGTVYVTDIGAFPGFAGRLWAVSASTGKVRWSHPISDYTGFAGDSSRTSPAVSGDQLIIGNWAIAFRSPVGANIIAVDRDTGEKVWATQVDSHPAAKITASPVVSRGIVYVGVSSNEEVLAAIDPGYQCCSFRGSVVALDARTGRILWKAYTVPVGYTGGAVWGSTAAVDPQAGLVYVGTGNNYTMPPGVCETPDQTDCTPPVADNHADAVLALDQATGAVRWAKHTLTADTYTLLCGIPPRAGCGPDFDFGSGPNLLTLPSGRRLLGIGQKSGVYWALDPLTGAEVWHTQVGPGGAYGGIQWGSATDGRRVYAAIANTNGEPYPITSATGQTSTIRGGSWAALDAATGAIRWQTADPQGAADLGFVSVANGVVYAGSTAVTGDDMYALDAATGAIRWRFGSGGSVISGAAIVNGTVYWGSGYYIGSACPGAPTTTENCPLVPGVPPPGQNNKLYAFEVADRG
jgi:polyvinyl alcohol dehydrogenase (cytochrome)